MAAEIDEELKRHVNELIALCRLESSEKFLFVEGPSDRRLLRWFFQAIKRSAIHVAEINVIRFERDDLERLPHADLVSHEQLPKDCAHLLESRNHLAPLLLAGISENAEVIGADAQPLLVGTESRPGRKKEQHGAGEDPGNAGGREHG